MKAILGSKFNLEKGWLALLKDLNIPAQDVLRYARLPLDLLLRKTPMVTADEYYRFWEGLAHVSHNKPDFALKLVENINAKTTDPAIIAFLSSNDLNMALERMAHYKPVVAPIHMSLKKNDQQTIISFKSLSHDRSLPALYIAFELTFWVQLARIAIREPIIPMAVHTHLDLQISDAFEVFLGSAVQSDVENKITFSASDAAKPFLTANHAMWTLLEPAFKQRMSDLAIDASFRERVRACLLETLASGHYSINYVASKLAVSNRTLQRRLNLEGTTFQKILDELREELARHYLSTTDYSSTEISFLLGYEEPNSFFRAFRTWTGQTPEIVRARSF
ncbi:MAG: AraC family transcriptional regulator ligand-binding domain-containing protein [Calditrichae bacterium]|nr:AraC family transcriptional regulator ligand-binding domain-containing protein [Calditrichia bacterium]